MKICSICKMITLQYSVLIPTLSYFYPYYPTSSPLQLEMIDTTHSSTFVDCSSKSYLLHTNWDRTSSQNLHSSFESSTHATVYISSSVPVSRISVPLRHVVRWFWVNYLLEVYGLCEGIRIVSEWQGRYR